MADQDADTTAIKTQPIELVEPELDVANDPAPETSQVAEPTKRRRGGLVGGLLGGVIAAGIGYGLAQYVPKGWPIQDTTALQDKLTAQQTEIEALKAKLDAPVQAPDLSAVTGKIGDIEARLAALESRPASAAAPEAELQNLQSQIDALKSAPAAGVDSTAIAAMMKDAEAAAAKIKSDAEATAAKASAKLALAQVQAALETGAPFASALASLGDAPAILTDNADSGLPTRQALVEAFPPAARAAIDAALRSNMGESWTDRATNFLRTQTGARSINPRDGTDPDAVLSRAEAALGGGDLKQAVAEVASLPEQAAAEMAGWRALAEKRLAAEDAVVALTATLDE